MNTGVIIGGSIGIVVGFFLTWKAFAISRMIGRVEWAERKLPSMGGTTGLLKLIGIALIIICFLYMSGACNYVITEWLGNVFQSYK